MADFTLRFSSGVTLSNWEDPAETDLASRINSRPGYPQKRAMGTVGVEIEVTATVDLSDAPLDSSLDERLFFPAMVDHPPIPPPFTSPAGQSSVQKFTPNKAGHYHLRVRRPQGGIVHLHVDVEDP